MLALHSAYLLVVVTLVTAILAVANGTWAYIASGAPW